MIYSRPLPGDPLFIAHARNSSHPIYHTAHVHTHKVSIYTTHIYLFLISSLFIPVLPKTVIVASYSIHVCVFWYTCVSSADYAPGSVSFHVCPFRPERFDSHVSSLFSYTCLRACTKSPSDLSGSNDCVLFRICGKRRDVDRSSRIVSGVQ